MFDVLVEKAAEVIENGISLDDFIQDDEIACMFEKTDAPVDFVFHKARRLVTLKQFLREERTEDEIIAAMRCVSSDAGVAKSCIGDGCPYYKIECDCEKYVMRDALALIERKNKGGSTVG